MNESHKREGEAVLPNVPTTPYYSSYVRNTVVNVINILRATMQLLRQTVIREKLRKALSYLKGASKMLMKMTPNRTVPYCTFHPQYGPYQGTLNRLTSILNKTVRLHTFSTVLYLYAEYTIVLNYFDSKQHIFLFFMFRKLYCFSDTCECVPVTHE
jgi:hypothetical protein